VGMVWPWNVVTDILAHAIPVNSTVLTSFSRIDRPGKRQWPRLDGQT
jgi:hypothetical protein